MLKVPNYPASCKSKRAAKVILYVLIVPNYPARGAAIGALCVLQVIKTVL